MVAVSRCEQPQASPKICAVKGTVTRYRCGFPACNRRYASTDGVRKHARKTHTAWLKAIDEGASNRDRQLESKPSTYCVMEVTDDIDDAELESESPAVQPTPAPTIPTMNQLRAACSENSLPPMPEGSLLGGSRDGISDTMAAATAACLAGAAPPLPLAWLLANSAAMSMPPPPTTAHALSGAMRSDLPIAAAASLRAPQLPPGLPLPAALQLSEAIGAALAGAPSAAPLPPALAPPGAWTPELMSLLAGTAEDDASKPAALASRVVDEDPFSMSSYLTPPISSTAQKACVSPFELEKRPVPMTPEPNNKACTTLAEDDSYNLFDDGQPFMREAEYTDFLETLLAL